MNKKYPIAHCPNCHRTILYSDDPKDKKDVMVRVAEEDYHDRHGHVLCEEPLHRAHRHRPRGRYGISSADRGQNKDPVRGFVENQKRRKINERIDLQN